MLLIAALVVTLAEPALRADTLKELHILAPPSSHGSLGGVVQWDTLLTKQQIVRLPFSGLSDCLSRLPQYLPVHFGETAAWHQLRFGAIPPRGVALELGARPWSDPVVGLISPELYPPEFVERIEAVWGSRAVVLGWNSAGALLNIVPVRWRAGRPYSRLWYLNAAYGTGGSDGGLTWNFHPRWGVHLGYRRVASEGRFPNGWANLWNVRSVLQWTPTPKLTVTLSELFTSWNGGLNGGIDVARTPQWWDELTAQVRFPQLNERLSRHDATVAMTFQQDSATTLNAQLWGVRARWEQQHREEFQPPEAGTVLPASGWSTLQMGLRLRGEHAAAPFALLAGVDLLWERIPKELAEGGWKGALYGLLQYATRGWEVYGGMRLLRHVGGTVVVGGGGARIALGAHGWGMLDMARGVRIAAPLEQGIDSEEVRMLLGQVQWGHGGIWLEGGGGIQRLLNAVIASSSNSLQLPQIPSNATTVLLLWSRTRWSVHNYSAELAVTGVLPFEGAQNLAGSLRSFLTVERRWEFGQASQLWVSLTWELLHHARPLQWLPVVWVGVVRNDMDPVWQHTGGELLVGARLGQAFVRLWLRNILGVAWYRVAWYPQPGRSLLFTLSWAFWED